MMKHMQQTSVKQTSVKVRREFDETFKRESVQHWLQSGKSAQVIAHELGLQASRLYAWKQQGLADVQGQLDAALREIGHLRERRDI
jgi:transposase-like protein